MVEAQQAVTAGSRDRARDLYRTAAKSHPTSKEPWLRLAEDHFEVGDYGQAILASQEVLHRDPNDTLATSVLAVSGLRLSSSALSMLRRNTLSPDARFEAEGLARTLREVLGEPVLVPRPPVEVAPAPPPPPPPPRRKTAPRRDRPTAETSAPAPAPKKPRAANPFDVLKK